LKGPDLLEGPKGGNEEGTKAKNRKGAIEGLSSRVTGRQKKNGERRTKWSRNNPG